jgi:hypothetical protein
VQWPRNKEGLLVGEQCAWGGGVRIDGGELVLGGRLGFDGEQL